MRLFELISTSTYPFLRYMQRNGPLFKIRQNLATQLGKPGADMNISNMMMRGHQLVIIDPIVGEWFN